LRYLVNGLRTDFDMPGTPIRMVMRAPDNTKSGRARKRRVNEKPRRH
jgi:GTP-binding protein